MSSCFSWCSSIRLSACIPNQACVNEGAFGETWCMMPSESASLIASSSFQFLSLVGDFGGWLLSVCELQRSLANCFGRALTCVHCRCWIQFHEECYNGKTSSEQTLLLPARTLLVSTHTISVPTCRRQFPVVCNEAQVPKEKNNIRRLQIWCFAGIETTEGQRWEGKHPPVLPFASPISCSYYVASLIFHHRIGKIES